VSNKCRIYRIYAWGEGRVLKMIANQYSDSDSNSESHVF
jgi:hypothetical protein